MSLDPFLGSQVGAQKRSEVSTNQQDSAETHESTLISEVLLLH